MAKQIYRGVSYKITPIFDDLSKPSKKQLGCLLSLFSPFSSRNCLRFPEQIKLTGMNEQQAQNYVKTRIDKLMSYK